MMHQLYCGFFFLVLALTGASDSGSVLSRRKRAQYCAGARIVSRAEWGARPPKSRRSLYTPVPMVIIAHTVGSHCYDQDTCSQQARNIQSYHMGSSRDWPDISYNFMIGGDGNVYEGRGWDTVGAHSSQFNGRSIGIAFFGNFDEVSPTPAALRAAENLLDCGLYRAKLSYFYRLYGHRQAIDTQSPGDRLFEIIRDWGHFTPGSAY